MKEWDKLKVFYHVATAGNISAAAIQLGITQPSVSRTIMLLEERIKAKLFDRRARGVILTKEGEILFDHSARIFSEVDAALKFIDGTEDAAEGKLKILTTYGLSYTWLVHFMPGFLEAYPKMRPIITGTDNIEDLKNFDIAILPFIPDRPDLIQRHLTSFHLRLFASRDYLNKFGTPKTAEDLKDHQIISYGEKVNLPYGPLDELVRFGHNIQTYIQINSPQGRLKLAQLGMGIAELGQDYPQLENVDLVEVLPDLKGSTLEFYAIYPTTMKTSERIKSLESYLLEHKTIPGR